MTLEKKPKKKPKRIDPFKEPLSDEEYFKLTGISRTNMRYLAEDLGVPYDATEDVPLPPKVSHRRFKVLGRAIGAAEEIIDGDGDGKYTAVPGAGDVTPVPASVQKAKELVGANGKPLGYRPARPPADSYEDEARKLQQGRTVGTIGATLGSFLDEYSSMIRGIDRDELVDRIQKNLSEDMQVLAKDLRRRKAYIAATRRAIMSLLEGERYKSQFETGSSRGWYSPNDRKLAEMMVMGIPDELPDDLRPVYGFLESSDYYEHPLESAAAEQYGDGYVIELDKEKLVGRLTVTAGDSLERVVAQPMEELDNLNEGEALAMVTKDTIWSMFQTLLANSLEEMGHDELADDIRILEMDNSTALDYNEVQVHGGLDPSEIKTIFVDDSVTVTQEMLDAAAKLGITFTNSDYKIITEPIE